MNLPILAAATPLPDQKPARELYWRLLNDCKAAVRCRLGGSFPTRL